MNPFFDVGEDGFIGCSAHACISCCRRSGRETRVGFVVSSVASLRVCFGFACTCTCTGTGAGTAAATQASREGRDVIGKGWG